MQQRTIKDFLSKEERSKRMKLIRSKDTKPELIVRKMVWRMGRRYSLHASMLPGKPDLVFSKDKKVIFVHGCFWHLHAICKGYSLPNARDEYWMPKLLANKKRDKNNIKSLKSLGWHVLVVWECELRNLEKTRNKIYKFLFLT